MKTRCLIQNESSLYLRVNSQKFSKTVEISTRTSVLRSRTRGELLNKNFPVKVAKNSFFYQSIADQGPSLTALVKLSNSSMLSRFI